MVPKNKTNKPQDIKKLTVTRYIGTKLEIICYSAELLVSLMLQKKKKKNDKSETTYVEMDFVINKTDNNKFY